MSKGSKGGAPVREAAPRNTIDGVQSRYGITFTEAELSLLTTSEGLLTSIAKQKRYILTLELRPLQCPACLGETCRLACDIEGAGYTPDSGYACNRCGAGLKWHMGFIDGWEWFTIKPGQTITVPEAPPAPRPGHRAAERAGSDNVQEGGSK